MLRALHKPLAAMVQCGEAEESEEVLSVPAGLRRVWKSGSTFVTLWRLPETRSGLVVLRRWQRETVLGTPPTPASRRHQ